MAQSLRDVVLGGQLDPISAAKCFGGTERLPRVIWDGRAVHSWPVRVSHSRLLEVDEKTERHLVAHLDVPGGAGLFVREVVMVKTMWPTRFVL